MKIAVVNARALAAALTAAAASAQAANETDFDLLDTLSALDDAARDQLITAIAQAEKSGE